MSDRITLTQPVYLKVLGQWSIVYGGSTLDVPSAAALAPAHVTNVLVGGGAALSNGHVTPVSNFRIKE
jgi:hypothetical protein